MRPSWSHKGPTTEAVWLTIIVAVAVSGAGCTRIFKRAIVKNVTVPTRLAPLDSATTAQLIDQINRQASVHSIKGKVDLKFEDTSFAESGISEKYKSADG